MAHNLNFVNGKAAMAYVGETPWHKLGTRVDSAMTSAEAIIAAGLNWAVEKRKIFFDGNEHALNAPVQDIPIPDKFASVRMDALVPLGVVGRVYRPLQNKEAFSFFDAIVGEKLAMYHTAGALGAGEKIWLLAKLPGECWIAKDDKIEKYLLLTNSHDGSSAVEIMATPIRVVCQNTLNVALSDENLRQRSKVRHTVNLGAGIDEIRKQLGVADAYYRRFEELGKHLVSKQANTAVVEKLLEDLGFSREKGIKSTKTENARDQIRVLFQKGKGNDMASVKGSAWALFNGVVEYVDYVRAARGGDGTEKMESRTNSLLFGNGAQMKQKALDSLIALTK